MASVSTSSSQMSTTAGSWNTVNKFPGAEMGKVVTRFPPEPSGYLHIGHAKAALLNHYFARQYKGTLILRFDDTNPVKEKMEFEDSIKEDLSLLQIFPDKVTHTSDYFDDLITIMSKLIKEGKAYVDNTPPDQMKIDRTEGIESCCRNHSVEENQRLWDQMLQGTCEGQKCCVRLRLNMKDKNKCMRDPTTYRCIVDVPHHKHGHRFKAYPTYDFACPVVDSMECVTHAMRTNEYADRIPQYKKVLELTGLPDVFIYEFSRLNFVRSVLSKRKLQWFVDQKLVSGWDDPRLPTVRGIIRRGLTVQALEEFLLEQGPSKAGNLMEWDKVWAKNKQIIDPKVPRFMAIGLADRVALELTDGPVNVETKIRDLHPKDPSVGQTEQYFTNRIFLEGDDARLCSEGEEITLMRWGNAVINEVLLAADRTVDDVGPKEPSVCLLRGHLHLEGDFKKTKKKLHWVPDMDTADKKRCYRPLTRCVLREYDHLILPDKIDKDDTRPMEEFVNPNTQFDTLALADAGVGELAYGSFIQLERRGYFRVDLVITSDRTDSSVDNDNVSSQMVLVKVPDGKSKSMSTVSVKVDAAKLSGAKQTNGKKDKAVGKRQEKKSHSSASNNLQPTGDDAILCPNGVA